MSILCRPGKSIFIASKYRGSNNGLAPGTIKDAISSLTLGRDVEFADKAVLSGYNRIILIK